MLKIRNAADRGHANHGWLDSHHTFSFADYYDANHMGFRVLRVINDDRVAAGRGFGAHPHRDMEILSYVLEGALAHKDSTGTNGVIRPGDVQRMTAGTGVTHSEENASKTEGVHFLQIWLVPSKKNLAPSYEQKTFTAADKRGKLQLVASPDAADGSVLVNTDARLYAGLFTDGERTEFAIPSGRKVWIQVARGSVRVGDRELAAGDGVAIEGERAVALAGIAGKPEGEVLLFDLA